ncbi:YoaK family protein [Streptomyces sp. NPDC049585]|uniref:YoaK family protein n=1 Tax=Streptomyces sp. NPDC049585 TaxID=3155154 RepID=UPI00341B66EA
MTETAGRPWPGEGRGALPVAMAALTVTTGVVEAVSFLVLGPVFTSVQTGNLLLLGFSLAGQGGLSPAASTASLGGFVVGAVLGSRFESGADARGRRWLAAGLVAEAVLLAVGAAVSWGIGGTGAPLTARHYAVAAIVAVAMGMRNITTLRAKVPDLPTTVATRALTGLLGGSPLAVDSRISSDAPSQLRRTATVGAMFAGGLLGAWALREGLRPHVVLLAAAGGVLLVAAGHAVRRP